jgi:hypothetical protein
VRRAQTAKPVVRTSKKRLGVAPSKKRARVTPGPSRSKRRKTTPPAKRGRVAGGDLPARIIATEKAVGTLGRKVKRGPIIVGKTRWITPTGSGWRALNRTLATVGKATRGKVTKKPGAYTFVLSFRFRGADGKMKSATLPASGFPVPKAVDSWRRKYPRGQKGKAKRKFSQAQAFRDLSTAQMIAAINRKIDSEKDIFGDTDTLLHELIEAEASHRKIRARMRAFKERRNLRVQITVRRET